MTDDNGLAFSCRAGNVKLKITHVLDASRFAARLLEYKDEDGSTVQVSSNYFAVTRTVYNHYSSETNRYGLFIFLSV